MRRIDTLNKATDLFGAGKHGWKNGIPGTADRPTEGRAEWFNAIQEEVSNVIEDDGTPVNPATNTQLIEAIKKQQNFKPLTNYVVGTLGAHLSDMPLNPKDFPWLAKFDGVTDDTAAINACATAARTAAAGRCIVMPRNGTALVSNSLNFSGISVLAHGREQTHIQASSAQFDVITTTGSTLLVGLRVHGGWDGATAGQTGDLLSIKAVSPSFPYNVSIRDCEFQYAKQRGIYWERGGYSSAWNVKVNACGLHGVELYGVSGSDACTTVVIGGNSVFSDCPNGFGAKLTNCINVNLDAIILEFTQGIGFGGTDNRTIALKNIYQEHTEGGLFITFGASSGIGLAIENCFGGISDVPYSANWQNVYYSGNSALNEAAVPLAGRVLSIDGAELATAAAGSFTAVSLAVSPGTWLVFGTMETINSVAGTIDRAGCVLTTNAADSGLANATGAGFVFGADHQSGNPGGDADIRCNAFTVFQNTTTADQSLHLRAYIGRTAGTIAYKGAIKAIKLS
jgi:hypothetical protein